MSSGIEEKRARVNLLARLKKRAREIAEKDYPRTNNYDLVMLIREMAAELDSLFRTSWIRHREVPQRAPLMARQARDLATTIDGEASEEAKKEEVVWMIDRCVGEIERLARIEAQTDRRGNLKPGRRRAEWLPN